MPSSVILEKLADLKVILEPKALSVIAVSCLVFVLLPNGALQQLDLSPIADNLRPWTGGLLILTSSGLLVHLLCWFAPWYGRRRKADKRYPAALTPKATASWMNFFAMSIARRQSRLRPTSPKFTGMYATPTASSDSKIELMSS